MLLLRSFLFALNACFLFSSFAAETIGSRYNESYPATASKKGLQVEMVDDALALGVKHAALNFNLSTKLMGRE